MVFRQKPLEKTDFIVKMTGPAGQFWQMESAVSYNREQGLLEQYARQLQLLWKWNVKHHKRMMI